jgi:hypothetical protein
MGERIRADIQAAYDLRSGWKIKDAISGLVIEVDGASAHNGNCRRDRLSYSASVPQPGRSSINFLPGTRFYSRYSASPYHNDNHQYVCSTLIIVSTVAKSTKVLLPLATRNVLPRSLVLFQ